MLTDRRKKWRDNNPEAQRDSVQAYRARNRAEKRWAEQRAAILAKVDRLTRKYRP